MTTSDSGPVNPQYVWQPPEELQQTIEFLEFELEYHGWIIEELNLLFDKITDNSPKDGQYYAKTLSKETGFIYKSVDRAINDNWSVQIAWGNIDSQPHLISVWLYKQDDELDDIDHCLALIDPTIIEADWQYKLPITGGNYQRLPLDKLDVLLKTIESVSASIRS